MNLVIFPPVLLSQYIISTMHFSFTAVFLGIMLVAVNAAAVPRTGPAPLDIDTPPGGVPNGNVFETCSPYITVFYTGSR